MDYSLKIKSYFSDRREKCSLVSCTVLSRSRVNSINRGQEKKLWIVSASSARGWVEAI